MVGIHNFEAAARDEKGIEDLEQVYGNIQLKLMEVENKLHKIDIEDEENQLQEEIHIQRTLLKSRTEDWRESGYSNPGCYWLNMEIEQNIVPPYGN